MTATTALAVLSRHLHDAGAVRWPRWPDVVAALCRASCAVRGHDLLLRFNRTSIWLECPDCGHRTPGWTVVPPHAARRGGLSR